MIPKEDLQIVRYASGIAGPTRVVITHIPTGLVVEQKGHRLYWTQLAAMEKLEKLISSLPASDSSTD